MTQRKAGANETVPDRSGAPVVLVIDDSDIDRETMAELLTRGGCNVHALPSPIGATRAARELRVQVVVIDQNLPAMDGSKLAALFRSNPAMRNIRLVLVSGNEATSMVELARQVQADAFVSKSSLHTELVSTVRRLVAPA